MMSLGRNQNELLKQLEYFSLQEKSNNICVIEGFSGLGKTRLIVQLQSKLNATPGVQIVNLKLPESSFSFDDFLLGLAAELSTVEITDFEKAIFDKKSPSIALQTILTNKKICIILDSFQNVLT
jgi:polyphosphate kinase 2 (PPK2 family)